MTVEHNYKMRVAYLITAYNNYEHLKELLDALSDHTEPTFYIHIDQKSKMPTNLGHIKNLKFINRKKIWWGGWSHLNAILSLMKAASKDNYDYYLLISGTDYPIRPNSFLYDKLEKGGEYLNIIKGFQSHKPEERIKYYYFDFFDRRNLNSRLTRIMLGVEKRLRHRFFKKKYPFKDIYHGSTWWALSHGTVKYILNYIEQNPKFVKFFKSSWCPEESFIPTIIGNSSIKNRCKTSLTYTDWSIDPGPATITEKHLKLFENNIEFEGVYGRFSPFFARKFNDNSAHLINEIEARLR